MKRDAKGRDCGVLSCFFFFSSRRRHTRFDCDWSSDVCSSDLGSTVMGLIESSFALLRDGEKCGGVELVTPEIGRASGRGRGEISGGAGSLKKKKNRKRSRDHTQTTTTPKSHTLFYHTRPLVPY